jgi:hypothetical protein
MYEPLDHAVMLRFGIGVGLAAVQWYDVLVVLVRRVVPTVFGLSG